MVYSEETIALIRRMIEEEYKRDYILKRFVMYRVYFNKVKNYNVRPYIMPAKEIPKEEKENYIEYLTTCMTMPKKDIFYVK